MKSEPGEFGTLLGEPAGWFKRASAERLNAEANLMKLATAIDHYGSAVSYQQSRVVQDHGAEQRRVSQDVPMPSADLSKVLHSQRDEQLKQFSERLDLWQSERNIGSDIQNQTECGARTPVMALHKSQCAIFNLTGDVRGEARIVERASGIGPSALTEAVAMPARNLDFKTA